MLLASLLERFCYGDLGCRDRLCSSVALVRSRHSLRAVGIQEAARKTMQGNRGRDTRRSWLYAASYMRVACTIGSTLDPSRICVGLSPAEVGEGVRPVVGDGLDRGETVGEVLVPGHACGQAVTELPPTGGREQARRDDIEPIGRVEP